MISDYGAALTAAMELMKTELTLWGFTFSMWQIFLYGIVVSIIIWVIWEVFIGD